MEILIYILVGYFALGILTTMARLICELINLGAFMPKALMMGICMLIWPKILQLWLAEFLKHRNEKNKKRIQ